MGKIGVFFKQDGEMAYPFNSVYFYDSYQSLDEIFEKYGQKLYILRGKENYLGGGVFKKYWLFEDGGLVQFNEEIKVDVVYDKGRFPFDDVKVLGGKKLNDLCVDKRRVYEIFPTLSPRSVMVWDEKQFYSELDGYGDDDLVVLKPNFGASGKGIVIDKKRIVRERVPEDLENGYLVQEFLDSSCGVEGLVDGLHDLRIVVLNGEPILGVVRMPKEGTFIANYSLGGSYFVVESEKIPDGFLDVVWEIYDGIFRNEFEEVLVSFDMMMTPRGIKLIEINSSPGLPNKDSEIMDNYYEKLVECLVRMATS